MLSRIPLAACSSFALSPEPCAFPHSHSFVCRLRGNADLKKIKPHSQ